LKPTLDDFLTDPHSRNAWVRQEGFESLYVRKGPRYLNGTMYDRVIDLANMTALHPGSGTMSALITRLHTQGEHLYVESILNQRLIPKLLRMGFLPQSRELAPSLYLLATHALKGDS
jgi:peptidoglycan/xylan/chitin deacetylase (PgdA/CDA1 family)